jgi:rSAM/selenodomain-associated transferase 1
MSSYKYPDTVLLVFAKAPIEDEVNTRLIPEIGVDAATKLQAELIHSRLESFKKSGLCELQLWCSPVQEHTFFEECKEQYGVNLYSQDGIDLGERMSYAFQASLKDFKHVVLIGTDAPALDARHIEDAIEVLHGEDDAVLVPAEDGGYVLIGMSRYLPELFLTVPWGSDRVLRKTRANATALGIVINELPTLWDIDRIEDYERYQQLK